MTVNYTEYMQSAEWRERRRYLITRSDGKCSLCNCEPTRANPLNAHHRTYRRLGREFDADLIVLCLECHDRHHGKLPEPPREIPASRMDELIRMLAEDRLDKEGMFELLEMQAEARRLART